MDFQIATIRHQIAATEQLIQKGLKHYIVQLIDLEANLEALEAAQEEIPMINQKPEPTHQQLWDSIQANEWVEKRSRSYDQDWDDNATTITTNHVWYEHPVWGVRDNLNVENPQEREARLKKVKTLSDRNDVYYAALREHKDNVADWNLETFYEHEKLIDWKQAYLNDSNYEPVTNEMLVNLAIADLYIDRWDRRFNEAMREKYSKK